MSVNVGLILFDGVEELDAIGPWEVFQVAARMDTDLCCEMASAGGNSVVASKGLVINTENALSSDLNYDVILLPGGRVDQLLVDEQFLSCLRSLSEKAIWVTSVCTGALVFAHAGLLTGKQCTSHHAVCDALEDSGMTGEVVRNSRYVQDGKYVTAAGVSAGIDMALWLVGQLKSPALAKKVQHAIEYYPMPPYANE